MNPFIDPSLTHRKHGCHDFLKGINFEIDKNKLAFYPGMSSEKTPAIYRQYAIFVNLSPSGMYDKTIFEAAACGAMPLSSNENLRGQIDERLILKEGSLDDLVGKLKVLLSLPSPEARKLQSEMRV